ncbi:pyridoxal phosphate-dependent decarboxylase family protein [Brevibacterium sediminis]|uniref:Pyridoxal-dependent decarboxylase n=1 Tax=Brevibacterium sediminis TaxID=1857024 RepID=A0ABQ1MYC7_9MICO|nr:pyridoxal-dependent decarboxylase [Brevibacterium sediminis]GGC49450.1 pyridoxal-dependent decarboxylase [Brevibacterium sediminis]
MTTSLLYDTEATPTSAPLQTPEIPHPDAAGTFSDRGAHTDALLGAHSADEYTSLMHDVVDILGDRFRTTERAASAKERSGLQAAVDAVDLDTAGVGNAEALREVDALYADNAVWFHHPSYVAHLNCPVAVPAVAAEAMLAAINTSVDTYDQSEVATLMERRLIDWTCGHLGFAGGDGIFTSGGTQSNLQALFLARENVLAEAAGHVEANDAESRRGGPDLGAPNRRDLLSRLRILATDQAHFSVSRAAFLLGLDAEAVVTVPTDRSGRMDAEALNASLLAIEANDQIPMAVVATAGTTDLGVIDPLETIAEVCESANVWLHVDAAYGGGLLWAPQRAHLLDGISRATSVTIDFHKTFFQPVSSSALLIRDASLFAPTIHHHDYLNPEAEAQEADAEPNQVDKSLQTTRRFDALKLWTTLRARGAGEIGSMLDTVCDLATDVRALLEDQADFEVLGASDLSTVLFRFTPATADQDTCDELVPLIRRVLFRSGRAAIARTVIDGTPWLKLTLLNPDTRIDDVTAVLDLVRATGHGILAGRDLEDAATEGGAA